MMEQSGRLPLMWAQSLYIIGCLLKDKQIAIGELDPINRRLSSHPRPETIVQVKWHILILICLICYTLKCTIYHRNNFGDTVCFLIGRRVS